MNGRGEGGAGLVDRRTVLAGAGALAVTALVAGPAAVALLAGTALPGAAGSPGAVTGGALDDIPADLLPLFLAADAAHGHPWHILAAVAWRESGWSPDVIACRRDSVAGARGLMQLMPGTAAELGVDPCVPAQAIDGAARYLAELHRRFGRHDLALAGYNAGAAAVERHGGIPPYRETQAYVAAVLERAARYAGGASAPGQPPGDASGDPARVLALADDGRIVLTDRERGDLQNPAMDGRVLAIMEALAASWAFAVSVLKTGHSRCVGGGDRPGCRESHHYHYRAVDIYAFDGEHVGPGSTTARAVVGWLATITGVLRPAEVGSPFRTGSPGHFTDPYHQRHVHIGYAANR